MIDINTSDSPSGGLNLRRVLATAEMENRAEDASPISYADRVELGYKAFEIGLWELGRDNHADARRWLQTAVDIGIDDAQPLLDICIEAQRPTPQPISDTPEPKRASDDQRTPSRAGTEPDDMAGAGTPIYWEVAAKLSNGNTPATDILAEQYDRLFSAWGPFRERVVSGLLAARAQRTGVIPALTPGEVIKSADSLRRHGQQSSTATAEARRRRIDAEAEAETTPSTSTVLVAEAGDDIDTTTGKRWDAFTDLRAAQGQAPYYLTRMLDPARGQDLQQPGIGGPSTPAWGPAVDIVEREDAYTVTVELPGVKVDDLEIVYQDGLLTIQGERALDPDAAPGQTDLTERRYGQFRRSFTLPRYVVVDAIEASFEDGVLCVQVPKTEEAKPKRIAVQR